MPTFTLTVPDAAAQRVAAAFGRYWDLRDAQGQPRAATAAEIKQYLARQLRGVVRSQETAQAHAAAEQDVADLEVT